MSQQSSQWESWQREGQQPEEQQPEELPVEQQPKRRGPLKALHSLNPQKLDLSSTKQQPQPHQNDDKKSENDEYVHVESPKESGIDETEEATGTWLVLGRSTEELTATIRQLENKKNELEKEKEELTKTKEELEQENKALQEIKDELEDKENEVIKLKQKVSSNKAILEKRLKDKDKELKAIKQQLERELAEAKDEVKLVKERFEMTKNEELKKQLNKLEEERNDKLEQLQQKDIKIKHLEEQLSEREKNIFDMEASIAADQKERKRLNKEKEEKEKESDRNIADATRHIDELERQKQEHLQVIKNLTEENARLRDGGLEREKLTRELNEKDTELEEQRIKVTKLEEEKEILSKEIEKKKKESDKNIADATQRINELERQHQEHLQAIKNLTEENKRLRVGGSEREKLTRELIRKDTELEEWRTRVTKLEEEMEHIRIEEGEKRAELENKFRREQEDSKRETQRLIDNLQEAARAKYDGRIKEWQAKLMEVEEGNKKLEEQLSEKEIERMSLSDKLAAKDKEILNLKEQLHDKGQKNAILQKSLDEKSQTAIALEKQVGTIMKSSKEKAERIKELVERLQLKETEITIIKEDFKSERNDRVRIHTQLTDLQGKCRLLKQELEEKEQKLAKAQMTFHNFQQSHSIVEHDLEVSQKRITTLLKKEAELSETIKSLTEEKIKMDKQLKEMEEMETERIKTQEEEIQVLTAQVNAYSRECEKQKGLVAQNQERHKTEIQVLNEKLTNEQKSKQQLEIQLTTMKQQLDSVSASRESLQKSNQKLANDLTTLKEQFESLTASRESLLTAYNQEQAMVTSLQQQLQRMREESAMIKEESAKIKEESVGMKQSNKVLKDKVLNLQQQLSSLTAKPVSSSHPNITTKICMRQNTVNSAPPTGNNPTPVQQGDGKAEIVFVKGQQVVPPPHAEQPDSVPDDTPHMTKEEIARLFKWQDQQEDISRVTVTQTPQQFEDSLVKEQRRQELAQKADEAVLEVEQVRKQPSRKTMLPHTHPSSKQEPVNQQQPKKKIKQQKAAADDSDSDIEENVLLKGIDDEIHEMAEEVRRMSRRPVTDEIILDNEDSSLPYDPNLVCPKCGRQYRVGEIQKLKRHMVEFCTGKR